MLLQQNTHTNCGGQCKNSGPVLTFLKLYHPEKTYFLQKEPKFIEKDRN
jgi:hypothetical protein